MTSTLAAVEQVLSLIDEPLRARLGGSSALRGRLGEALARGGAPRPASWLRYLAARAPDTEDLDRALQAWRTEELRLCHDYIERDGDAIAHFLARYLPVINATLGRLRIKAPLRDELKQQLVVSLLVGDDARPPLIANYRGLGKLDHWLRVVTARAARHSLERERRVVPTEEDLADRLSGQPPEPELVGAKAAYRKVFHAAFKQAVRALSPRELTILRQRYFDGLPLDQLGAVYRVHASTAHRWLGEIQRALLERTREIMAQQLGFAREEWSTIVRMIQSEIDLTLSTIFLAGDTPSDVSDPGDVAEGSR